MFVVVVVYTYIENKPRQNSLLHSPMFQKVSVFLSQVISFVVQNLCEKVRLVISV